MNRSGGNVGTKDRPQQGLLGEVEAELDVQPFFQSRRAAAVFKHAVLEKYLVPFVAKAGYRHESVSLIDGYAGAGRYDDGQPGSPLIVAEIAKHPSLRSRRINAFFVEQDAGAYARLSETLSDTLSSDYFQAFHGDIAQHLGTLLEATRDTPLFIFLDPFGLGLDFETVADIMRGRPQGPGVPATEILLRFDASAVRRIRGQISSPEFPAKRATAERLNRAAGGSWWCDENDPTLSNEEYLEWFQKRLLTEFNRQARCGGWAVPVKQREDHQPAYILFFFSHHNDGLWIFGEAISSSLATWRRAVLEEAWAKRPETQEALIPLDLDEIFERDEQVLADTWVAQIESNVRGLLEENQRFSVKANFTKIFGDTLGLAREKHLRSALKRLHRDGLTQSNGVGRLIDKLIVRASEPSVT